MSRQRTDTVIHLVTSLDFGGVERRMEVIAANMRHTSRKLIFCAIGYGGKTEIRLKKLGAEVICLQKSVKIPSFAAMLALISLFRKLRPEVVHTHGAEANFHGLIAAWLAGVPVRIGEEIGTPNHSRNAKLVFRFAYLFARAVIGNSRSVIEWLVSTREVMPGKIRKVYNPIDLPNYNVKMAVSRPVRFCFVGRLEPIKNPEILVKAFSLIHQDGRYCPELWVIGDGSQRHLLEQNLKAAQIDTSVKFFGYQSDPFELIGDCDVFVQPSLTEGFSNALVEAMGCGLPVLVTDTGAAAEIVIESKTGWIIPTAELGPLIDAMIHVCSKSRAELVAMGKLARVSVEDRFEPQKYLATLDMIYKEG